MAGSGKRRAACREIQPYHKPMVRGLTVWETTPAAIIDNIIVDSGSPWPHDDDDGNWCYNCVSYQ